MHYYFARLLSVGFLPIRQAGWVLVILQLHFAVPCISQDFSHKEAHAHNDYDHPHPLFDALKNGFTSVETDIHLRRGILVVAHNHAGSRSPRLEKLYLRPLDSLQCLGHLPAGFFLMIDIKTDAEETYRVLKSESKKYPALLCSSQSCPVKIFLSGNRPMKLIMKEGYQGIGIDGRPVDLGNGFTVEMMPVVSDHYKNWSSWNGRTTPSEKDLIRIVELAKRVHAEGKKLRLWAIPDNELAWEALLNTGVDFINTDHLKELNEFLKKKGH